MWLASVSTDRFALAPHVHSDDYSMSPALPLTCHVPRPSPLQYHSVDRRHAPLRADRPASQAPSRSRIEMRGAVASAGPLDGGLGSAVARAEALLSASIVARRRMRSVRGRLA